MRLNADFSQGVLVHAAELPWVASPIAGVDRRMLDRIGDEVARATSLVRYAPGSQFSQHVHGGGEEFLVLEGVFQDEHGGYPVGTYVRNPPYSAHTPASASGCVIFVKLWQFDPEDRTAVVCDSYALAAQLAPVESEVAVVCLHADAYELVTLEDWPMGVRVDRALPAGAELLVLDGALNLGRAGDGQRAGLLHGGETMLPQSWLRLPPGSRLTAEAGPQGCRLWCKTGHLRAVLQASD